MSSLEAIELAKERFGDKILEAKTEAVLTPWIKVSRDDLVDVATFFRDDARLQLDMLHCLTAVDYPKEHKIELVYDLDSVAMNHVVAVRVELPRDDAVAPTLEHVWATADWHEREAWDLMGVRFEGHHNLVRILCAEDWEGHPLRKDYEMPAYYHGIPNDFEMFYDVQNP